MKRSTLLSGSWRSTFWVCSSTFLKHKPALCLLTESPSLWVSWSPTEEPSPAAKRSVRRQRPKQIRPIGGLRGVTDGKLSENSPSVLGFNRHKLLLPPYLRGFLHILSIFANVVTARIQVQLSLVVLFTWFLQIEVFFKPSIVLHEGSHTCLRAEKHVYSSRDLALISLAFLKCLQPSSSPPEQTPLYMRSAAGLVFLLLS